MKKLISAVLLLALCLSLFAGCSFVPAEPPATEPPVTLDNAKEFLDIYMRDLGSKVSSDIKVPSVVTIGEAKFTIAWTCDKDTITLTNNEETGLVLVDLPVPRLETVDFNLTAVISDSEGNKSDAIVYSYTANEALEPNSLITIPVANKFGNLSESNVFTTDKYYVVGVITEVYNTEYGNMYIKDEAGNKLTIYGSYSADGKTRYDALDVKPVAGDTVKVYGVLGNYKGTAQIKNGWIVEHTTPAGACEHEGGTATCTEKAICTKCNEAYGNTAAHAYGDDDLCTACGKHNPDVVLTLTNAEAVKQDDGQKVIVTGIVSGIKEAWSDYKNMSVYIIDEEGNTLYVYRMKTQVELKDIITVTGVVGSYKGDKQIAQGATAVKTGTHTCSEYTEATCTDPAACIVCGIANGTALGHLDENKDHICERTDCGATNAFAHTDGEDEDVLCDHCGKSVAATLATFEFGENGEATHFDGITNDAPTSYTETNGTYTLNLTDFVKTYTAARDAKGNSCLKLGTSSAKGSYKFTVPEDVTEVVFYVAGYKAATSTKFTINGTEYTSTTASNNGEYIAITIDTTETKDITFASVTNRLMINTIVFKGAAK